MAKLDTKEYHGSPNRRYLPATKLALCIRTRKTGGRFQTEIRIGPKIGLRHDTRNSILRVVTEPDFRANADFDQETTPI